MSGFANQEICCRYYVVGNIRQATFLQTTRSGEANMPNGAATNCLKIFLVVLFKEKGDSI